MRGISFLIIDQEMDKVFLGRPLLKSLKFDLGNHLEQVRYQVHKKLVKDLGTKNAKLSSEKYKGISYCSEDYYHVELPEGIATGFGRDTPEEITNALGKIQAEEERNGISPQGDITIRQIMNNNRDVLQIKQGGDTLAKVPPFQIRKKPDARPYRSPQRRHELPSARSLSRKSRNLRRLGQCTRTLHQSGQVQFYPYLKQARTR